MDPLENQNEEIVKNNFLTNHKKIIFCVLSVLVFFSLVYFVFFSAPVNFPKGETLKIEQGQNPKSIAKVLQDGHFITSKLAFEFFVVIYGGEKHISPGDYLFEKKIFSCSQME